MPKESIAAVIVAAGLGARLGSTASMPKGMAPLCGKPLFLHSLEVFAAHGLVDEAVLGRTRWF